MFQQIAVTNKGIDRCPFCGWSARSHLLNRLGGWAVGCDSCGAASGVRSTEAEAISSWNTRHSSGCALCGSNNTRAIVAFGVSWWACNNCGAVGPAGENLQDAARRMGNRVLTI